MDDVEEEEDKCPICLNALQKDSTKFIRYLCCGKGIHKWCHNGMMLVSSLSQKNSCPLCRAKHPKAGKEEIVKLRAWVEKGKAWAQDMLGEKYLYGFGVEQSKQKAIELFELSARQGFAKAQFILGCLYDEGQGVDQSYKKAAEYYEAAAGQGIAGAQYNMGSLCANGYGVKQSFETARNWWMKAAAQGEENAIKALQDLDEEEERTTPSFIPTPIECASCYRPHGDPKHKLSRCNGCRRVYYCGRECQVKHWNRKINGHKKNCKREKRETVMSDDLDGGGDSATDNSGSSSGGSSSGSSSTGGSVAGAAGGGEEPKTTTATRVTFRF